MTRAPAHLYQRPSLDHAGVMETLARMEHTHRNNATAAVAGGAVICLLVALVLTLLYQLMPTPSLGSFKVAYVVVAVVCLPGLFWLAWRYQRMPVDPTVDPADAGLLSERGRDDGPPLVNIGNRANVGPRLVLWGVDQLRHRRSAFGPVPHERVASALVLLAGADAAVSPAKLLLPGESADQLQPLLAVLLHHDLADVSKNADRVWVTTDAKKRLGLVA